MKITLDVFQTEVEGDSGYPVDGLELQCPQCGHSIEVSGTHDGSAKRGAVMMREECPREENNFYEVNW